MLFTAEQKSQLAKLMATENLTVEHQKIQTARFDPQNRILYLPIWQNMTGTLYDLLCGHEVGIFRNDEDEASAEGYLVHVYVDRATQKTPTPLPENLRAALQRITLNPA